MKHTFAPITLGDITLRLAQHSDIDRYYNDGFAVQDKECDMLTGSEESYPRPAVDKYVANSIDAHDRYLLLLVNSNGKIVGESVLNCIDTNTMCCNYRIAIWDKHYRNHGYGTWAVANTVAFGFDTVGLEKIELDVFSFNPRAKAVYDKVGFAVYDIDHNSLTAPDGYPADDILMSLTKQHWQQLNR